MNLSAGQTVTNVNAALTQGGRLEGVVTDSVTGEGIANSYVGLLDARGNYVTFGYTDPNGRYEISGVAPGTYYVSVYPNTRGVGASDQPEFYGGTFGLAGAKPVTITAGATTAGIDIALSPASATSSGVSGQSTGAPPVPSPHVPVAVVTRVNPGPPTLFGGSLSGLGKDKPVVRFRLRSGSNGGHKLRSFKVKLPAGLAFVPAQLHKAVKVTGGGKVTERIIGGQLVVTLSSLARMVTVQISSPAVKVSGQLAAKAAGKRAGTLRVTVTVTPVNAAGHMLSFTAKNPAELELVTRGAVRIRTAPRGTPRRQCDSSRRSSRRSWRRSQSANSSRPSARILPRLSSVVM